LLDLLIHGGEVIDGSGAPRWRADLGVSDGRIVAMGDLAGTVAFRHLDARGHIVAPGFIDSHSHDDAVLLQHPARHPKLEQGVTTVITGNCGISLAPLIASTVPAPLDLLQDGIGGVGGVGGAGGGFVHARFANYVQALRTDAPDLNAALLVGHTTLRVGAMADLDRAADANETKHMQAALMEALQAGAIGMSTGVFYPPARAATTQELIDVGQPLAGGRGIVTMHIRDESDHIINALKEAFAVGRALNAPLVLSHHKLIGQANHGRSVQTLALVEEAARTQSVCLDCYPYTASSTMLLPERVASSLDVQITWSHTDPTAAGRSLRQLAAERGVDATALAAALMPAGAIYFAMSDVDLDRILTHPLAMIGSDGLAPSGDHGQPHPRLWGTFPRLLGHYARERQLLALEAAVHKMTGLTAQRFGLAARGLLRPGFVADITVFDAATVADRATYANPTAAPTGIHSVLLGGKLVVQGGRVQRHGAGALLLRKD